jgi:hypothetical protein
MDIGVEFLTFLMFVLTLAGGLCCAWFIHICPVLVLVSGDRTSSIDLAQLSGLLPEDAGRNQSPKRCSKTKS